MLSRGAKYTRPIPPVVPVTDVVGAYVYTYGDGGKKPQKEETWLISP